MTNKNNGDLRNCLGAVESRESKVERENSKVESRRQSKLKNEFKWQAATGKWQMVFDFADGKLHTIGILPFAI
jgi:hypothetical protein